MSLVHDMCLQYLTNYLGPSKIIWISRPLKNAQDQPKNLENDDDFDAKIQNFLEINTIIALLR